MDLVTGATGIVGTHVLLELLRAGRPVRALHRADSDRGIVQRVFRHYGHEGLAGRIEWAQGDLQDVDALRDALQGITHVYHAAAVVSFDPRHARSMYAVNAGGTANLVDMALEAGVCRLCHVSSTAAIGSAGAGAVRDESMPWADVAGTSDYSRSKHLAEMEVQRGIAEGLDAVIVNPSVIIGPGAPGRSSMALLTRLRKGTRFYTRGTNAFVDARDVAACMVALIERGSCGERYLIPGENATYRSLFEAACRAFGNPAPTWEAKAWMLHLAWRAERLRSLLTGSSPLVTRTAVASALARRSYSDAKAAELLGYRFRALEESVANAASFAAAAS